MGISSIPGVARAGNSTADTPAPAPRQGGAEAPAPKVDAITQQPLPPRFPWLSRLALQLEPAAKQKPAFPPAPMLGDHVDKSA